MEHIVVEGLARLPTFSHAVIVGETVYVSGCLGTLPNSMELAPGGVGPETSQALANIARILDHAGAGLADVVKVNVYLADMSSSTEMNDAYLDFFAHNPPARITVGGVDLALGGSVEIDCIAVRA